MTDFFNLGDQLEKLGEEVWTAAGLSFDAMMLSRPEGVPDDLWFQYEGLIEIARAYAEEGAAKGEAHAEDLAANLRHTLDWMRNEDIIQRLERLQEADGVDDPTLPTLYERRARLNAKEHARLMALEGSGA
jgi:hypothetical protein